MATLDVLTLDEGKQALNATRTTASDLELAAWITAVSQRLDELVGPVVARPVVGEAHDGGRHVVLLTHYPVRSITSVAEYVNGTEVPLAAETHNSTPAASYLLDQYEPDRSLWSNWLRRRRNGTDALFVPGRSAVVVSYEAGRFDNTAGVDSRFKIAAMLMLKNLWRSQEDSVATIGEFDVPASSFPTFAVPRAVREMFPREIQEPRMGIA
ncbi:hypothetical protein [Saccharopolyspora sp. NPDC002686]|uniref:hypothetical protein n=1 Tax=Saccharopolyspora sp. NPDC002686 TaxID=3154541 RepID=UPI003325DC63